MGIEDFLLKIRANFRSMKRYRSDYSNLACKCTQTNLAAWQQVEWWHRMQRMRVSD